MKFIGTQQLRHEKDLKDSKIATDRDNIISIPSNTTVSFSEMRENRGNYFIIMAVARDFGSGTVTKTFPIVLR